MPSASPAVPSTRRRHQTASTKKRRLPVDHPPARALLMLPPFFWQYVPLPALALLLTRFQVTLYGGPTSRGSDTAMLPSAAALRVRTLHARPQPEARSGMPRGESAIGAKNRDAALDGGGILRIGSVPLVRMTRRQRFHWPSGAPGSLLMEALPLATSASQSTASLASHEVSPEGICGSLLQQRGGKDRQGRTGLARTGGCLLSGRRTGNL